MRKKKTQVDRSLDILEANAETNFELKLSGMPSRFFVSGKRLAEFYGDMRTADWDDYVKSTVIWDKKYGNTKDEIRREYDTTRGYRIPVKEEINPEDKSYTKLKKEYGEKTFISYGNEEEIKKREKIILQRKIEGDK